MMKADQMRKKNSDELKQVINQSAKELLSLRMQAGTGQLTQSHRIKLARRDIARALTLMTQKERCDHE